RGTRGPPGAAGRLSSCALPGASRLILRPMDAHPDRAEIGRPASPQAQERSLAAIPVDGIGRVADVSIRPLRVRRLAIDSVGDGVREVELARVDDVAAHVHLYVDVHGPARVPAGIYGLKGRDALRVGPLDPAHERPAAAALSEAGVDARRVAVPDVDRRALDRPARRGVDDGEPKRQRGP